jgi:GT2 family glycosyltransferase
VVVSVNDDSDGAVSDAVRATLAGWSAAPLVEVVTHGANLGFSAAHNRAAERLFGAGHDAVLVLNPDLVLEPNALGILTEAARARSMALWGPALLLADTSTLESEGVIDTLGIRWTKSGRHLDDRQGRPASEVPSSAFAVDGISGACVLVPEPAYRRIVGGSGELFDEDFFAYREDAELGLRAALLGVPSYLEPAARGRHARQQRGTKRDVSVFINQLSVRNRFLLAAKYGRHRPGGAGGPMLRDLVVVLGVLLRERELLPALGEAWRMRRRMAAKGRRVMVAAAQRRAPAGPTSPTLAP